jgi:hypothetical protein
MRIARLFPAFSVSFAVIYLICMYNNIALVSYFPRTRELYPLTVMLPAAQNGPGMYWYGWLLTSTLGAVVVAFAASFVPERVAARVWTGWTWVVPILVILVLLYILRTWFIH